MKNFLVTLFLILISNITTNKHKHKKIVVNKGVDLNKGRIQKQINQQVLKTKQCLYRNGINPSSFYKCCGEQYIEIENKFENIYIQLKQKLYDSFAINIPNACQFDKKPCQQLIQGMDKVILNDNNVYEDMLEQKNQIIVDQELNYVLLDMEFDRLKNNFETFQDAKNMLALSFNETIDFIEKYVHSTEYRLNLNNKNYDSQHFFQKINYNKLLYQKELTEQQHKDDFHLNQHIFQENLLKQVTPLQILMHQISTGKLQKEQIDFQKMPSEIIKELKI